MSQIFKFDKKHFAANADVAIKFLLLFFAGTGPEFITIK